MSSFSYHTRIPFGKHKGSFLYELPDDYVEWLLTIDLRDPLRSAVRDEFERRRGTGCVDLHVADEIVSAGVRVLAKKRHPDLGGSHEHMKAVNVAADWLRQQCRGLQ